MRKRLYSYYGFIESALCSFAILESKQTTKHFFKHWNWVVKNDLKGKINQTESLLKKHENELFILEHSPEYDSESLHRLTSEVENLTNEINKNNKFIEECNIEIRRLEKLSQGA